MHTIGMALNTFLYSSEGRIITVSVQPDLCKAARDGRSLIREGALYRHERCPWAKRLHRHTMRVPQTPDFELSERSGGVPVWANDMLLGMYGPGQDKITVYGPQTNGTSWDG